MIVLYLLIFIASHAWTSPTIEGDGPEPRKCHSAAFHEARMCIFGGSGKSADDEIFYNDLYWLYTTMGKFSINHFGRD